VSPLKVESGPEGVRVLVLNRPEKRNALNGELVEALQGALEDARTDPSVRVVLLRGEGPDFCSGADLAELERMAEQGPEASLADAERMGRLFLSMRRHPRPVVAAVHGRALAGGCGLAMASDLIVADEEAELGFPEVHLGFVPAMVMTLLRRKVGEARAFELVTLGDRIDAKAAADAGLVNRLAAPGLSRQEAEVLAGELARRPSVAVELTKRLLYGLDGASVEEGVARGAEVNTLARLTEECRQRVRAFLERTRG
jgi:methylglutaconyl-CoA hydratase